MAIDRDDALRKAEKLLRQGRLDGAIAEYEHVVDAYPDDIATASAAGRPLRPRRQGVAGRRRSSCASATTSSSEGVQAKAAASYRKVLKLDPHHEGALLQLVEACAQQGQLADAKTHLQAAIDKRKARGDQDGADALVIRLAELDPNDFEARLQAASIRVRTGKVVTADLLALAQELDVAQARRARPRRCSRKSSSAIRAPPRSSLRLAKAALARDEVARAKRFLPDTRGSKDPELLLTGGKILLKLDNLDAAREHLERFLVGGAQGRRGSGHARRASRVAERALRHRRPARRPCRRVRRLRQGGAPAAGLPREGAAPSRRRCCGWSRSASTATSTRR